MPVTIKHRYTAEVLHAHDGADLRGADLSGADLRAADLYGAYLRGANLSGAKDYVCLGYDPRGYHFRAVATAEGWRVTAGCRDILLPAAREHWRNNPDALGRLSILDAHALPSMMNAV